MRNPRLITFTPCASNGMIFSFTTGGGGHAKAAGALIPGSMEDVRLRVISAARAFVSNGAGPSAKEALA